MGGISIMSVMAGLLTLMSNKLGLLMSSNFGMLLMNTGAEQDLVDGKVNRWSLGHFLKNSNTQLIVWFKYLVMIIGVVCILVAIFQIVSGLISHGKKQTNWAVAIILLMFGGILALTNGSGWDFMVKIAGGGKDSIEDLGGVDDKTTTIDDPSVNMIMPDLTVLTFDK